MSKVLANVRVLIERRLVLRGTTDRQQGPVVVVAVVAVVVELHSCMTQTMVLNDDDDVR